MKIIVALDVEDPRAWLPRLKGRVAAVKIGFQAFTQWGPQLVQEASAQGLPVFLDLKYHDIPNTVAHAVSAAAKLGVWMLTVHTQGGAEMLQAARKALGEPGAKVPLLLGVTVLTSQQTDEKTVLERAQLAQENGCDGVICSPLEIAAVKKKFAKKLLVVTPGVRLSAGATFDDQKRTATPQEAVAWGADYLVIGRPVTGASDPAAVLKSLQIL